MKTHVSAQAKKLFVILALAAVAAPTWATTQTVKLFVPGMTCGACPITVRMALKRIAGVENINIDEAQKRVAVTFDDAKTNVQSLTKATKEAGYPSSIVSH